MITTKRLALVLAALAVAVCVPPADAASAAPSRVPCPPGAPAVDPTTGSQCPGGSGGNDGRDGSDGNDGDDDSGDDDGGDGPARPPTRAEIETAAQRRVLVKANTYLLQPKVSFDGGAPTDGPDVDADAHVGIATFVEVTNWQGVQVDRYSEVDSFGTEWFIEITATPHLRFDPGEPGAPVVRCEDGGTAYDPNGPRVEEQAARPGACAYAYTMRTGVDGRPDAWPGRVIVDWTIGWETNLTLPVTLPTSAQLVQPAPREIDEISTIVVED
jgi:hypothetical protein